MKWFKNFSITSAGKRFIKALSKKTQSGLISKSIFHRTKWSVSASNKSFFRNISYTGKEFKDSLFRVIYCLAPIGSSLSFPPLYLVFL